MRQPKKPVNPGFITNRFTFSREAETDQTVAEFFAPPTVDPECFLGDGTSIGLAMRKFALDPSGRPAANLKAGVRYLGVFEWDITDAQLKASRDNLAKTGIKPGE